MRPLPILLLAAVLLAACASSDDDALIAGSGEDTTTTAAVSGEPSDPSEFRVRDVVDPAALDEPPTAIVSSADGRVELSAWTTCWANYCADGAPSDDPPTLTGDSVLVEFPVEGWEFSATSREIGQACGRTQTVDLEVEGPTVHRLDAFGLAGDRAIDLFGRGPGGDVAMTFRWVTAIDGTLPTPEATVSVLATNDGVIDSYGVEFTVVGLDRTPDTVDASVTVTSASGNALTIALSPTVGPCGRDGELYLSAPIEEGLAAADLGTASFTYDVDLVLDGVEHRATAIWPDDTDPECAPCVPLAFAPALPAMTAPAG